MARIALLFSGLPRQWSHCVQSQLGLFQKHEVDVFFHFWDTVDCDEKRQILAAYRPKDYLFEPAMDFTPWEPLITRRDNMNSPSRMFSMYYSWKQVSSLFEYYWKLHSVHYDYLVRLRADLMFFESLDDLLPDFRPNQLLVSDFNNFDIINDMFVLGGVTSILYYLSLYDRLMQYKEQVEFNPEHLLAHHLKQNRQGIELQSRNLVMLVFRPHMVGMSIEDCLKEHPGASKWKDPEIVASHSDFHGRQDGEQGIHRVEKFRQIKLKQLEQMRK